MCSSPEQHKCSVKTRSSAAAIRRCARRETRIVTPWPRSYLPSLSARLASRSPPPALRSPPAPTCRLPTNNRYPACLAGRFRLRARCAYAKRPAYSVLFCTPSPSPSASPGHKKTPGSPRGSEGHIAEHRGPPRRTDASGSLAAGPHGPALIRTRPARMVPEAPLYFGACAQASAVSTMPECRNSASICGSRPRKARNDSSAGRLPPTARISSQKRRPMSALAPPASSKAA